MVQTEKKQKGNPEADLHAKEYSHKDLQEVLGENYREEVFDVLNWLKIVNTIEEVNFRDATIPHGNSDGHYFLEQIIGDHRIYSYIIRAEEIPMVSTEMGAKTSEHKHEHEDIVITENYFVHQGQMILDVEEDNGERIVEQIRLDKKTPHAHIFPNHFHQGRTNFAFVTVVMPNAASIPEDEIHIPRIKIAE